MANAGSENLCSLLFNLENIQSWKYTISYGIITTLVCRCAHKKPTKQKAKNSDFELAKHWQPTASNELKFVFHSRELRCVLCTFSEWHCLGASAFGQWLIFESAHVTKQQAVKSIFMYIRAICWNCNASPMSCHPWSTGETLNLICRPSLTCTSTWWGGEHQKYGRACWGYAIIEEGSGRSIT